MTTFGEHAQSGLLHIGEGLFAVANAINNLGAIRIMEYSRYGPDQPAPLDEVNALNDVLSSKKKPSEYEPPPGRSN